MVSSQRFFLAAEEDGEKSEREANDFKERSERADDEHAVEANSMGREVENREDREE